MFCLPGTPASTIKEAAQRRRVEPPVFRAVWALLPPPPLWGGPASGLRVHTQTRAPPTVCHGPGDRHAGPRCAHGRPGGVTGGDAAGRPDPLSPPPSSARPAAPATWSGSVHCVSPPPGTELPSVAPSSYCPYCPPDVPTVGRAGSACSAYFSVK